MGSRIKRIDLLGVPGTGKSTLYNELVKRRSEKDNWMTPDELITVIAATESAKNAHSIRDIILTIVFKIRLFKRIHPFLSNIVLSEYMKQLALDNKDQEPALDNLIKVIAASPYPAYVRLVRYTLLFEKTKQMALLQKYGHIDTTLLCDGSLTQKFVTLGPWNSHDPLMNLKTFYDIIGELYAIIFLDADERIILERLANRKPKNTAHIGLNDHELVMEIKKNRESARQLVSMFKEKGVTVIRVNAAAPLVDQVRFVENQLQAIL